jgi:hypothetical protein
MKKLIKHTLIVAGITACVINARGGNPDRAGQAGATELQVNSWARSSGWGGVNSASIRGLESTTLNVAGLAHLSSTEVIAARTNWLVPSGININNIGLGQRVSESGVLALTITSIGFGDIPITTVSQPEGGLGTFRPQFINIGLGYAHRFSSSITGGLLLRAISQEVVNVKAQGFSVDAGIQYATTSVKRTIGNPKFSKGRYREDMRFGIALRNVGPDMVFRGDGLSITGTMNDASYSSTMENRAAKFNLPSLLNIGFAYDFRLDKDSNSYFHRLTAATNFTSNTFSKNQLGVGLEYSYKEFIMFRAGFNYEDGLFDAENRTNALTGFAGGVTLEVPFSGNTVGIDYSYRSTNPFQGIHSFGLRLALGNDR